jgi:uncharacterized integral membrane protein
MVRQGNLTGVQKLNDSVVLDIFFIIKIIFWIIFYIFIIQNPEKTQDLQGFCGSLWLKAAIMPFSQRD